MKIMTFARIKELMLKHYDSRAKLSDRKMHITLIWNDYGKIGSIVFSIDGSPPKGYAIYITQNRLLNFYNNEGKRWKIENDIDIDCLEEVLLDLATSMDYKTEGKFSILKSRIDGQQKKYEGFIDEFNEHIEKEISDELMKEKSKFQI